MSDRTRTPHVMPYFVTLIENGYEVMSFIIAGCDDRREAEELALSKYPENPLTGNKWTDINLTSTQYVSPHTVARAFVLRKVEQ